MSLSIILPPETDTEKLVRQAVSMRLTAQEGLKYCKNYGVDIELQTYYNLSSKVKREAMKRLSENDFLLQHDERITTLEKIHTELWLNYYEFKSEDDKVNAVKTLKEIKELQPYLSTYHEATKYVLGEKFNVKSS